MNEKIKKLPYLEQFRHLQKYLILAGIKKKPKFIYTLLFGITGAIDAGLILYFFFLIWTYETLFIFIIIVSLVMLTLGYLLIFMAVWLGFLFVIDYLKFKRRTALEEILPEFLRLVSANHRAGLPLDISLWKANRPRFGILSQEINEVARRTYGSGDLIGSLQKFGTKYDSPMLIRVISNIVEGLTSGADIASLLDDISINITTIRNTRKEMASEVENYMLFITVTVLIISPLMFGLTHKMSALIETVKNTLADTMGDGESGVSQMPMQLEFAEEGSKPFGWYFDKFVYLMVATNSIISVLLMSLVKYGNVKQEIKRIPVYFVIAIVAYNLFKLMFSNFIVI
jgi:flagellar protein FlaJ